LQATKQRRLQKPGRDGKQGAARSSRKLLASFHVFNLWLHILSAALWVGSISFFLFVFAPAVHSLSAGTGVRILDWGRQRLESLSWFGIAVLLITGILNFIFRAQSSDFHITTGYSIILGIKLFLFLAMAFHHSLQTFKYGPKIVLLTAQAQENLEAWPEPLLAHWKKWFVLLKINATLGVLLLLLGLALTRI
jgi:uncharacterized membrane protein